MFPSRFLKIVVEVIAIAIVGSANSADTYLKSFEDDWGSSRFEWVHSKSGWWKTRQVTVREGTGPPNITFEIAWKPSGSEFAISTFTCDNPSTLLYTFRFKGKPTRFTDLRAHDVIANDYWTENGQGHKVFPSNVFVGKAVEAGRPVTYVWAAWEKGEGGSEFKPVQLVKLFASDTRHLDGLAHDDKGEGDYLIEHAPAAWIPREQWPKGVNPRTRLNRKWSYVESKDGFVAAAWKIASP